MSTNVFNKCTRDLPGLLMRITVLHPTLHILVVNALHAHICMSISYCHISAYMFSHKEVSFYERYSFIDNHSSLLFHQPSLGAL